MSLQGEDIWPKFSQTKIVFAGNRRTECLCEYVCVVCVVECCVCECVCGVGPAPSVNSSSLWTQEVCWGWGRGGRRKGDLLSEAADRRMRSQTVARYRREKP